MAIHIGCGSWADDPYVGVLYPKGSPKTERLRLYTGWFDRVELNVTYHAVQPRERIAAWVDQTPPHFRFDVKLQQRFSEDPRSAASGPLVETFLNSIESIVASKKLGAFLFTLAPRFGPARHRLDELDLVAEKFSPHAPVAVELRDRAWIEGDARDTTLAYFRERQFAWVALDLPHLDAAPILPPIDEVTHPSLAYMRLHGRNPDYLKAKKAEDRHNHIYTDAELEQLAARIRVLASHARDVHVSVNTHYRDYAPRAALALRRLLGQPVPPPLAAKSESADGQLGLL